MEQHQKAKLQPVYSLKLERAIEPKDAITTQTNNQETHQAQQNDFAQYFFSQFGDEYLSGLAKSIYSKLQKNKGNKKMEKIIIEEQDLYQCFFIHNDDKSQAKILLNEGVMNKDQEQTEGEPIIRLFAQSEHKIMTNNQPYEQIYDDFENFMKDYKLTPQALKRFMKNSTCVLINNSFHFKDLLPDFQQPEVAKAYQHLIHYLKTNYQQEHENLYQLFSQKSQEIYKQILPNEYIKKLGIKPKSRGNRKKAKCQYSQKMQDN